MARTLENVLNIMRRQLGKNNPNDPDSSNQTLITYFNDAYALTMSDDVKLFEQFGTLEFNIGVQDPNNGVYTFNDVGASSDFVNISQEAFISLLDPIDNSISWNQLPIYQDPGEFFAIWGINNDEILIPGYPTMMLYYGNEFTFRTIPNTDYVVKIYGYKRNFELPADPDPSEPDTEIAYDYWLRYIALLATYNYAMDYRYESSTLAQIKNNYSRERKLMLTRTHNQIKMSRAMPRF